MHHENKTLRDIACSVPNVKRGPNIQLHYDISAESYDQFNALGVGGYVMGEDGLDRIGSFILIARENEIQIKEYFPIGCPGRKEWKKGNQGKGISQTFLFWLSNLAEVNKVRLNIKSNMLNNYHIFRKYFADEVQVDESGYGNAPWHSFEEIESGIGMYSDELIGQIEIRDATTLVPTAYVRLERINCNGQYSVIWAENNRERLARLACEDDNQEKYTPKRYADELMEGIIVNIDKIGFIRIDGEVIGIVNRPIGTKQISVRGRPRIPDTVNVKLEARVEDFSVPQAPERHFRYLMTG